MASKLVTVLLLFLPLTLVAQNEGGQTVAQPQASAQGEATPEVAPEESAGEGTIVSGGQADLLDGIIEDYDYRPDDKRDPFRPFVENESLLGVQITEPMAEPLLPLERFDIDQLKLVGIIWGSETPKAMFVDPGDRTYIVTVNDRIGQNRGYIAAIREGEVVVVEPYGRNGTISYQTRVIGLQRPDQGGK